MARGRKTYAVLSAATNRWMSSYPAAPRPSSDGEFLSPCIFGLVKSFPTDRDVLVAFARGAPMGAVVPSLSLPLSVPVFLLQNLLSPPRRLAFPICLTRLYNFRKSFRVLPCLTLARKYAIIPPIKQQKGFLQ